MRHRSDDRQLFLAHLVCPGLQSVQLSNAQRLVRNRPRALLDFAQLRPLPLRTLIQRIASSAMTRGILALNWGRCLLAATQTATFFRNRRLCDEHYMVAPLLAGASDHLHSSGNHSHGPHDD